jgi:hypothetical protein
MNIKKSVSLLHIYSLYCNLVESKGIDNLENLGPFRFRQKKHLREKDKAFYVDNMYG